MPFCLCSYCLQERKQKVLQPKALTKRTESNVTCAFIQLKCLFDNFASTESETCQRGILKAGIPLLNYILNADVENLFS